MTSSFSLGRIAGIEVGVNWSWLVVFALIVWSLASGVFPRQYEGLGDGTYLAMAIVTAVLFFVSLLLHELGHAVVARREGMEIEGITLWLFGGVAKFKGMFPSAGAEFRIAIAGPLVSLALGLGFAALGFLAIGSDAVEGVVGYLGWVNLLLLAFNMLPALPLDGGRVLRAALWGARRDFALATRLAANVGRGFGFLFIGGGLFAFFVWGAFGGAWLAFIGWFLLAAASGELRYLSVREAFGGLRVRDLMVRDPAVVDPGLSLGRFMDDVVWSQRHTTYPVVEAGRPVGLLPFRCVAEVPRGEWDERTVRDCMIPLERVTVLSESDRLTDAAVELGEDGGVGRALVVEGGRLVGFLSVTDLARALELGGLRRRRPR
ncbi:MAG: site-2 protease family protein [Actinomycetota bacterium]|nr:site-2 protease family protein [Actinomycetota bacterium]